MKYKSRTNFLPTNTLNPYLKIKSRKFGISKSPPPQRRDQMLRGISRRKNRRNIIDNDQYILSYEEPYLCNNYISKKEVIANRFSLTFSDIVF